MDSHEAVSQKPAYDISLEISSVYMKTLSGRISAVIANVSGLVKEPVKGANA